MLFSHISANAFRFSETKRREVFCFPIHYFIWWTHLGHCHKTEIQLTFYPTWRAFVISFWPGCHGNSEVKSPDPSSVVMKSVMGRKGRNEQRFNCRSRKHYGLLFPNPNCNNRVPWVVLWELFTVKCPLGGKHFTVVFTLLYYSVTVKSWQILK